MNFKKLAAALMAAALCVTGAGCSRSAENSGNTGDTGNTDGTVSDGGSAREFDTELTAMQLTSDIKIGWNLGNTLDATGGSGLTQETSWGNPAVTPELIQAVKDAGFNAIRVPTTWERQIDDDGTISADWMSRVQQIVDYAYDLDMYVILNMHHEEWYQPYADKEEEISAKLSSCWTQIAENFKDYDQHLIFEGMNEPRMIGSAEEWTGGTQESYDVINALYQAFVDTVRSSGGSNTDRTVIVSTYAQSVEKNAVNGLIVPKDDHVIVSLHIYAPWKFCGNEDSRSDWGSDADKKELDDTFQYLSDTFISKGTPVIIDECGAINKNENTSARAAWYGYYISAAKQKGIKCFVWDNGEKKDGFALLNRKDCTWYYPEIIQAIQNAVQ